MHVFILVIATMLALPLSAQNVTATKLVDYRNGKELLRQINGRWWTQDNREVNPPSETGYFWVIDSEPGVVDFYHHNPFDIRLAERLHLFMMPAMVEAMFGKPTGIFQTGPEGGFWYYYAADGMKLMVRFRQGVVGEAEYEPLKGKQYSVASLATELNGRSIYKVMAERAGQRSGETQTRRTLEPRAATLRNAPLPIASTPLAGPVPEKRIISREALAGIQAGMPRADLLAALGEPSSRLSLSGGDGVRETFR
jgi:hypothetical protein